MSRIPPLLLRLLHLDLWGIGPYLHPDPLFFLSRFLSPHLLLEGLLDFLPLLLFSRFLLLVFLDFVPGGVEGYEFDQVLHVSGSRFTLQFHFLGLLLEILDKLLGKREPLWVRGVIRRCCN